jgi:hypothetical protein
VVGEDQAIFLATTGKRDDICCLTSLLQQNGHTAPPFSRSWTLNCFVKGFKHWLQWKRYDGTMHHSQEQRGFLAIIISAESLGPRNADRFS